jgi:type II secretion system protein N
LGNPVSAPRKVAAPVRVLGLTLAFVLLTCVFIVATFPYERLREPIADQLGDVLGANVRIGELAPRLSLLGPGLRASSVLASWPGAGRQSIDHAFLRPGWSTSWLSGVPTLYLEFQGEEAGAASGTLRTGDAPAWVGQLEDIDLTLLPLDRALGGAALTGRVNADVDIALNPGDGPPFVGSVRFDAHAGSFRLPDLPIALPYDTLEGELVLGGELQARIERLSLEGAMLRARVEGEIGGGNGAPAILDLAATLQSDASAVQSVLRGYGVETDADGHASFHIGGSPARPQIQATQ